MKNTESSESTDKKRERRAVIFLTVVLAPVLAVLVVAGFGFVVWMYQLVVGPPGM